MIETSQAVEALSFETQDRDTALVQLNEMAQKIVIVQCEIGNLKKEMEQRGLREQTKFAQKERLEELKQKLRSHQARQASLAAGFKLMKQI